MGDGSGKGVPWEVTPERAACSAEKQEAVSISEQGLCQMQMGPSTCPRRAADVNADVGVAVIEPMAHSEL